MSKASSSHQRKFIKYSQDLNPEYNFEIKYRLKHEIPACETNGMVPLTRSQ